jgi:hypothetical protein
MKGSLPHLSCRARQPETAPGTVTGSQPLSGIRPSGSFSGVRARGLLPEAFRPWSSPSQTMAKRSPPMPLEVGSTTVRQAAMAMAASTALPPFKSISIPAKAARGWLVATAPRLPRTTWRREG